MSRLLHASGLTGAVPRVLGKKMALTNILTAGAALCVASIALIVVQFLALRGALADDLRVQARIIGNNSSAALMFHDARAGEETLGALAMSPSVMAASIFDAKGATLAHYRRGSGAPLARPDTALAAAGHDFGAGYVDVVEAVRVNDQQVGLVRIRATLDQLFARLARSVQ